MKDKPEVIFIDWSGTLSTSRFWGHWEGIEDDKYQAIQSTLFQKHGLLSHLINPWMRGQLTAEDVVTFLSQVTCIGYDLLWKNFIESCQSMTFVSKDVLPLVSELRDLNIKVVIATDNMDSFSRWTVNSMHLDTYFDGILSSYELKALKGDFENEQSLFFSKFFSDKNLLPESTVIIDDSSHSQPLLSKIGMGYRKIESGVGLVPELEKIVKELRNI